MNELAAFQDEGVRHLTPKRRGMLLVDMGLGKTPMAAKINAILGCRRWLISCPENAVNMWGRPGDPEHLSGFDWIQKWTQCKVVPHFMDEEPWNRKIEWCTPTPKDEVHLYIVVHNTLARDCGILAFKQSKKKAAKERALQEKADFIIKPPQGFDCLIIDEARRMRNKDSALFRGLCGLFRRYDIPNLLYLEGTPSSRGPQDLWTMLHLIDRKRFRGYWNFVHEWCITDTNYFGGIEIVEPNPTKLPQFHAMLREYAYIVKEDDPRVANERPPITRQRLPISMDADQLKLYREFEKESMFWVPEDDRLLIAPNSLAKMTRLKQIMTCPQILSPSLSPGSAIKDVSDIITDQRTKLPIVIFTPYVDAFEPFSNYLRSRSKHLPIITLSGGVTPLQQAERLKQFRNSQGVAIVSIQYAQSFSLEPASKAFFIGCDWDTNVNRQAEKRLLRMTTKNAVNIYYYTTPLTLWDRVLTVLNFKYQVSEATIPGHLQ